MDKDCCAVAGRAITQGDGMGKRKASTALAARKPKIPKDAEKASSKTQLKQEHPNPVAKQRSSRGKQLLRVPEALQQPSLSAVKQEPPVEAPLQQELEDGKKESPAASEAELLSPITPKKEIESQDARESHEQANAQAGGQRAGHAERSGREKRCEAGDAVQSGDGSGEGKLSSDPHPEQFSQDIPATAQTVLASSDLAEEDEDPEFWATVLAMEEERERRERQAKVEEEQRQEQARRRAQIRMQPSSDLERTVWINRGPVLTLWAAVVAERQGYAWHEAVTFGRAVASKCAHAKGQRLGLKTGGSDQGIEFEEFEVFGMWIPGLRTRQGVRAVQDGHPIAPSTVESYLVKVFSLNLDFCKAALEVLASALSPEALGGACFRLYEAFRPSIPTGTGGWGAKGVFDLKLVLKLADECSGAG